MSVTYRGTSRLPRERGERGRASVVMAPVIDRSSTDASLLLRCDRPASISVSVSGIPFPEVTWFVGSRMIMQDSPEYRVDVDFGKGGRGGERGSSGKLILSVSRVTEELERGIRVEAVNCAGSDKIRIKVRTYKVFSGRSEFEWMKSSSLPPGQRYRFHHAVEEPEVKFRLYKGYKNQFQTAQTDYETWEEEMKIRKRMRSIDDIFDNLSDQGSSETNEAEKRVKSFPTDRCNRTNCRGSSSSPLPDKTNHRHRRRHHREPSESLLDKDSLWELFGTRLSDVCRRILSSENGNKSVRFPDNRRTAPAPFPTSRIIQSCSLPVLERRRPTTPSEPREETAISGQGTEQEELARNYFVRRSFGGETQPPPRRRPRQKRMSLQEGNSPSKLRANPLVTTPPFFEAEWEATSDVPTERVLRPKNSTQENVLDNFTAIAEANTSHEVPAQFPIRLYHPEPVAPRSQRFFSEEDGQSNSRVDRSSNNEIQDCRMKLVDGRPTNQKIQNHGAFENQSIPEYDPRRNTYLRNCRRIETIFIDNTRTISINVSTSRSYVEIAKKELPMRAERDTSFCCPAVTGADEGIPLAGSGEPCTDGNPTASVRRTRRRIQSSGSVDDFLAWNPNSAGLLTMSTSVGQLSWRRYQTHAGVHGLGQDRARSAARSTGHTTAGGANLPPPGQGALEPRPGVSRSVDNLDARDAESTSRIDKEWKMVTVTMKEETIVIRQPASEVEMPPPPPSPENSSIRVENSIVWKLPLGSGRPIAV